MEEHDYLLNSHEIILDGTRADKRIVYKLRVSTRARAMRLSIDPEHGLVATLPRRAKKLSKEVQKEIVERFIKEKSVWVQRTLKRFESTSQMQSRRFTAAEISEYKKKAQTLAATRLAYFNKFYGFTWARISIRDQKTRWGSCSRKGNLNFNYKIALLEPSLADYIIVHELCHLKQMNHSPAFWKLVEKTISDYAERRAELKRGSVSPG